MTEQIAWREWGQNAFDEAAGERKPILLDISAVWCHWCHVMDETTYSDPEVVERVNRDFVPIRVDTDRRPDVNSRYNMGGWPTTVFLTPHGEILTGATYLPPEDMRRVLGEVVAFYREHEAEILAEPRPEPGPEPRTGPRLKIDRARREEGGGDPRSLDQGDALEAVAEVVGKATEAYDSVHGGFGTAPKFPHTKVLELLLVTHLRTGPRVAVPTLGETLARATPEAAPTGAPVGRHLAMVEKTLKAMRRGGIYDQVGGGFFRYSTTRDWAIPHYEKMLEDNAELLSLYARVARLTGDPFYLDTVQDVVSYLVTWLRSEDGYFYGSQAADESYYKLDEDQRLAREAPRVDRTLFAGWNALAVRGFLEAYLATRDVRLRETGLVALEAIWGACRLKDGLVAHYRDETGMHGPVLLEDAADLALAFLDAYEATGERSFLDRASGLLEATTKAFGDRDPDGAAYYDTLEGGEKPGHLRLRQKGLTENARLALALLRLGDLTMDPRPRELGRRTLAHFLGPHRRHGILAADYALALDRAVGPTAEVTVAGRRDEPLAGDLFLEAAAAVSAARSVRWSAEDGADLEATGLPATGPRPGVYICSGETCLAPILDPGDVADAVREAARRDRAPGPGVGAPPGPAAREIPLEGSGSPPSPD